MKFQDFSCIHLFNKFYHDKDNPSTGLDQWLCVQGWILSNDNLKMNSFIGQCYLKINETVLGYCGTSFVKNDKRTENGFEYLQTVMNQS